MKTSLWEKVCQAHGKYYKKSCVSGVSLNFLPQSYVRVRYEDLVSKEHTMDLLKELYDFMGIQIQLKSQNSELEGLLHAETNGGYYGLSRDKDFDPNHWTKELSSEVIVINSDVVSLVSK